MPTSSQILDTEALSYPYFAIRRYAASIILWRVSPFFDVAIVKRSLFQLLPIALSAIGAIRVSPKAKKIIAISRHGDIINLPTGR